MSGPIEAVSTIEVKKDLRHKIRSLFCNALSTFAITWLKKIVQLLSCGSYCFVPLLDSAVDGSVIVVFIGHPHSLSDKTVRMYR